MRLRSRAVLVIQVLTNQVICSTTDRVHGSNLGPSRIAIVARGHPLPPGAAQADARTCRCLSARLGRVPKAGPPQVMAGMGPVLTSTVALRLREASHLTRALRPLAEDKRFRAWLASRRVPQLTGVPRSSFNNSPEVGQLLYVSVCKGLILAPNHGFGPAVVEASVEEVRNDLMKGVHEEREGDGVRGFADL